MSLIDEYKSLREEIIQDRSRQLTIVQISLTATSAFIALIGKVEPENSLVFLVPLPVLIASIAQIKNTLYSTMSKATYIREIIEPQIPELNWETYLHSYRVNLQNQPCEHWHEPCSLKDENECSCSKEKACSSTCDKTSRRHRYGLDFLNKSRKYLMFDEYPYLILIIAMELCCIALAAGFPTFKSGILPAALFGLLGLILSFIYIWCIAYATSGNYEKDLAGRWLKIKEKLASETATPIYSRV